MNAQEFNPEAPFIAQDGLEYEDLAAYILQQPADCWRDRTIQEFRQAGRSEAGIRAWIEGYDGDDPTPTIVLSARADAAETSIEAVSLHARLSRRSVPAYSRAYAVEPCDAFCPF